MAKKDKSHKKRDGDVQAGASSPEAEHHDSGSKIDSAELAMRLNSAAIHLLRRLQREDSRLGLSAARLSALSVLVFGGPKTLGQLADAEAVSPPSMTRLVNAMEAEGLVVREKHATDARSIVIHASPKGEDILVRGRQQRVEALARLLDELPAERITTLDEAASTLEELLRTGTAARPKRVRGGTSWQSGPPGSEPAGGRSAVEAQPVAAAPWGSAAG
jgi:DNA-binding MarR family transcriptional regulator